jgi:predicted amidophosphoribosyltransferase
MINMNGVYRTAFYRGLCAGCAQTYEAGTRILWCEGMKIYCEPCGREIVKEDGFERRSRILAEEMDIREGRRNDD